MIEFAMPSLGSDMDEGTITEWLVKPGDKVSRGQVVAVVDTTKAAVEVECWHDGVITDIAVPVGTTVEVGTVLATLLEPGESPAPAGTVPAPPGTAPAPPGAAPAPPAVVPAPPSARAPNTHRASPAARREAAALGIDLAAVAGTGPAGAVTLDDVHAAASSAAKPVVTERAEQMRRSIAAAMSRSKREIPHYYLSEEVILDGALAWLTERNAHRSVTERLLPAVLQLKAVALAAHRFGELNGFWRNAGFESATAVHLGVAISLRSGGLVAPAIHDAAVKPLDELMADLTDLVARARAGSLRSSEMSDPTITVTNLGDQGIDAVFGVIYPPQVALVGFGKPAQRACVIDGEVRAACTVTATLSADHRASDGHCGALFLAEIANLLQQPEKL